VKRGYTKFSHAAHIGTKTPALCGKKPPRGRAWKDGSHLGLPKCEGCEKRRAEILAYRAAQIEAAQSQMWLAS